MAPPWIWFSQPEAIDRPAHVVGWQPAAGPATLPVTRIHVHFSEVGAEGKQGHTLWRFAGTTSYDRIGGL